MIPWPDLVIPLAVAILGGGGVGAIIQARTSGKVGVREQDVAADKNSGDLALELVRELRAQIKELEDDRRTDREELERQDARGRRLEGVLDQINRVLAETIAALDDLIRWETDGSQPPPPWRLADIRARLARLLPKETPHA